MTGPDARQVVLVTGGASGLGETLVRHFIDHGYRVCATVRGEHPEFEHQDLSYLSVDMADHAALANAVDEVVTLFGRIDCLVCNAAVQGFGHVDDITRTKWQEAIDVNLTAPFLLAQAAARHLKVTRGLIVFVSSVHGVLAAPSRTMYAVTKAGLIAMARNMAADLAPDRVRALSLILGPFGSPALAEGISRFFPDQAPEQAVRSFADLQPLGRVGSGQELGDLIQFLMSEAAGFISGTSITVDGGQSSRLAIPAIKGPQ